MFRMRLTESEFVAWRAQARQAGVTLSAWVRSRVAIAEPPPVTREKKGTPVAAVVPAYDKDRDQAPPVGGDTCRRCGHARASHWIKGCLAGCLCSEGRYRE